MRRLALLSGLEEYVCKVGFAANSFDNVYEDETEV
jgi:hypothetical protein